MNQTQKRQPGGAFARSGLADQPQRFSRAQMKAEGVNDPVMIDNSPQQTFTYREGDTQIFRPQQHRGIGCERDGIARRLAIQQAAGIRVFGGGKQRPAAVLFHAAAVLHHRDAVGELTNDAQIMGDKQQPHIQLLLQFPQQREDLRLHRHVQRGGGFVGNKQLRAG